MKKMALFGLLFLLTATINAPAIAIQTGTTRGNASPPPRFKVAAGATIYADAINGSDATGDGSQALPFRSATAAAAAATDGDTIQLLPGTYSTATTNEDFGIRLPSGATLKGSGPDVTKVLGANDWTRNIFYNGDDIFDCSSDGTTTIQDLTVGGSGNDAISGNNLTLVIKNVVFDTCYDTQRGGGVWYRSNNDFDSLSISECVFKRNNAGNSGGDWALGGAIFIEGATAVNITDCIFTDCTAAVGGAVFIDSSYGVGETNISRCRFSGNTSNQAGGAIYLGHLNRDGTHFGSGTTAVSAADRIAIGGTWNNILTADQQLVGQVTLQGTLTAYYGSTLESGTVLAAGSIDNNPADQIAIGGTWDSNNTLTAAATLSGPVTQQDSLYAAVNSILAAGTVLTAGSIDNNPADQVAIGGVWPLSLYRDVLIGIPFTSTGSIGIFGGTTLPMNTIIAAGTTADGSTDRDAIGGTWTGADPGPYTLTAPQTLIAAIGLSGLVNVNAGSFFPGRTPWIIDPAAAMRVNVSNCLIEGNTAGTGGGAVAFDFGQGIRIFNNTIAENTGAGTLWNENDDGLAALYNNILWGNTSPGSIPPGLRNCAAVYSIGQVGTGEGNISDTDPLFRGAGDYHLQPASPALWPAGISNATYAAPTDDLDKASRHTDGHVSMGAYEFSGSMPYTGK